MTLSRVRKVAASISPAGVRLVLIIERWRPGTATPIIPGTCCFFALSLGIQKHSSATCAGVPSGVRLWGVLPDYVLSKFSQF